VLPQAAEARRLAETPGITVAERADLLAVAQRWLVPWRAVHPSPLVRASSVGDSSALPEGIRFSAAKRIVLKPRHRRPAQRLV
jgi:hypothetical protein